MPALTNTQVSNAREDSTRSVSFDDLKAILDQNNRAMEERMQLMLFQELQKFFSSRFPTKRGDVTTPTLTPISSPVPNVDSVPDLGPISDPHLEPMESATDSTPSATMDSFPKSDIPNPDPPKSNVLPMMQMARLPAASRVNELLPKVMKFPEITNVNPSVINNTYKIIDSLFLPMTDPILILQDLGPDKEPLLLQSEARQTDVQH